MLPPRRVASPACVANQPAVRVWLQGQVPNFPTAALASAAASAAAASASAAAAASTSASAAAASCRVEARPRVSVCG